MKIWHRNFSNIDSMNVSLVNESETNLLAGKGAIRETSSGERSRIGGRRGGEQASLVATSLLHVVSARPRRFSPLHEAVRMPTKFGNILAQQFVAGICAIFESEFVL